MSLGERIELINNIATICLVIICLSSSTSSILDGKKRLARIFAIMIIATASVDLICFFVRRDGFEGAYWVVMSLTTLNFIFRMAMASLPVYYKYNRERRIFSGSPWKGFLVISVPLMVGSFFMIYNIFSGVVFSLDSRGYYADTGGMHLFSGIIIVYLFAAVIMSLFDTNRVANGTFVPIYILVIPVIIGVILRSFLYPAVAVEALGGAASLLIYVLSMTNAGVLYDSFTRVYNKEYLPYFFEKFSTDPLNKIGGIMIDVNDLKKVNDKYGHKAGDDIILKAVRLVTGMGIENSSLVRYGGDEFIFLVCVSDINTVRNIMIKLKERLIQFAAEDDAPYKLSMSMGATIYIPGENIGAFLRRMDEQMYFEKKAYHEETA